MPPSKVPTAGIRLQKTVALLNETRIPNRKQLAETLGVSPRTAGRYIKQAAPLLQAAEEAREQYKRLLGEKLPLEHRAERLAALVNQDDQLMVALKAIQYADQATGMVESGQTQQNQPNAPAFVLPPGTRVAMMVGPAQDESRDTGPDDDPNT